jgi:hypothetical protein
VHDLWPYILLGLLGAYHGLNPAMGWLFAVALGMQERSRRAVLRSLVPIAIGHELSIVLVAVVVVGLGLLGDTQALHLGAGIALIGFGVFRFARPHAHFRWTKLRVNRRELGWWSFLMSTAHGAGLMLFPVILRLPAPPGHLEEPALQDVAAVLLHTAAMLATMAVVAVLVYDRLGVMMLRRAWVNMDAIWAVAVVAAGVVTLFT